MLSLTNLSYIRETSTTIPLWEYIQITNGNAEPLLKGEDIVCSIRRRVAALLSGPEVVYLAEHLKDFDGK